MTEPKNNDETSPAGDAGEVSLVFGRADSQVTVVHDFHRARAFHPHQVGREDEDVAAEVAVAEFQRVFGEKPCSAGAPGRS